LKSKQPQFKAFAKFVHNNFFSIISILSAQKVTHPVEGGVGRRVPSSLTSITL